MLFANLATDLFDLITLLKQGVWRSGSALPSHGRGHWFDPSYAHVTFKIGEGSIFEYILALVFTALIFVLFFGTLVVFITVLYQNTRDKWPTYSSRTKTKIIRNSLIWPSVFLLLIAISMMQLK